MRVRAGRAGLGRALADFAASRMEVEHRPDVSHGGDHRRRDRVVELLRALTRQGDAVVNQSAECVRTVLRLGPRGREPGCSEVPRATTPLGGGSTSPRWRRRSPPIRPPTCGATRTTESGGCLPPVSCLAGAARADVPGRHRQR